MLQLPFHLQYTLSRSQRLGPLLRIPGTASAIFVIVMFVFFVVQMVVSIFFLSLLGVVTFAGLALFVFSLYCELLVGLVEVLRVPARAVNIIVEKSDAGILVGEERWYLFLYGIKEIRKYRSDLWTIRHFSGTVFHVPVAAITDDQLAYLKAAMEHGKTPEGIQAVIERGRKIKGIMDGCDASEGPA